MVWRPTSHLDCCLHWVCPDGESWGYRPCLLFWLPPSWDLLASNFSPSENTRSYLSPLMFSCPLMSPVLLCHLCQAWTPTCLHQARLCQTMTEFSIPPHNIYWNFILPYIKQVFGIVHLWPSLLMENFCFPPSYKSFLKTHSCFRGI